MRHRDFMTVLAGAAAYPTLAGAQQKAMPVVGFLSRRQSMLIRTIPMCLIPLNTRQKRKPIICLSKGIQDQEHKP
jgi:hypothetical protein